jgi:allantoin racemase
VDSLGAWVRQAEASVDAQRAGSAFRSTRGYFSARPDPGRIDEVFAFYGLSDWLKEDRT